MAKNATATVRPNTPAASSNAGSVLTKEANTLRKIADGETFSPSSTELEPGRWQQRFSVKPDDKSTDRYEVVSVFDFRSASAAEIQQLALKHCTIVAQRNFRDMAAEKPDGLTRAMRAGQWAHVNVKTDIVDAARKSADPIAKAMSATSKALAGLDADARKKLIAELAAMAE